MGSLKDIDNLSSSCSKLNLIDDEKYVVVDEDEAYAQIATNGKPCLLGRLLTVRPYRKAPLLAFLHASWHTNGWLRFKEIRHGVFLIIFEKRVNMDKVISEGPWLFSKNVFVMQEIEGLVSRNVEEPVMVQMWVHLYGLPPLGFTAKMGMKFGEKMGAVLSVDAKKRMSWRGGTRGKEYIRVRILFNVSKPLMRGAMLAQTHGEQIWISFRYEKLSNFCYRCGCLGHVLNDCGSSSSDIQYGDWLHVNSEAVPPSVNGIPDEDDGPWQHLAVRLQLVTVGMLMVWKSYSRKLTVPGW